MKLIFSLFLFSQITWGREIIIIEHIQNNETASMLKNILVTKFQLPEALIKIRSQVDACSIQTDAILHLCVQKDGELEIKKINKYVLKSAFNIFFDLNEKIIQKE